MSAATRFLYWSLWLSEHLFGSERLHWRGLRDRVYRARIRPRIAAPNRFRAVEVLHARRFDRDVLKKLPRDRPVVIRGLVGDAAFLAKWDWDYLRKSLAGTELPFVDTWSKDKFHSGRMPAEALFESILSETPRYSVLFSNLNTDSRMLACDLELGKWLEEKDFRRMMNKSWQIFLAGKGRETRLHGELGTTISVQLAGRKRWLLFDPRQSIRIHPKVNWKMYLESGLAGYEEVRDSGLGLDGYEVELVPGDVLYFPPCFWHVVRNVTESVSVSFKWTELRSFFELPLYSFILLTSRKPLALFRLPLLKRFSTTYPPTG